MKALRWTAAAVTVLMSLMNLPAAFDTDLAMPAAMRWAATVIGVLGLVAAVGLVRRAPWGRPAVLAIGGLNLAGAVVALVNDWEGAAIGLAVSLLTVVLGYLADRTTTPTPAYR